jgi:polysaccharide biosynthesis transport protein
VFLPGVVPRPEPFLSPSNQPAAPAAPPEREFDVREYLRALRAYLWLILLVTVVVGAAVLAYTVRQPRIFEATTVIEYDPNPARPLGDGVEDVAAPNGDFWASREFFETQNRIIGSRLIAERVVERLGLAHDRTFPYDDRDMPEGWEGLTVSEAALILQTRVTIEAVSGTRLVNVRVRDRSPERASLIANTIAEVFIEKTIEDRLGSTVSSLEWLGEQLDDLRGELATSERALHDFMDDHDILSVSMEDRQNLVAGELEHFTAALAEARTRRIELQAHLTRLRYLSDGDEVEDEGSALSDIPAIQALQTQIRTHLAEREALSSRYGPAHPRIIELDHSIDAVRAQLRSEIDGLLRAAEADVREATAIEGSLRQAVDDANQAGLALNLLEIEYNQHFRERENNEKLYEIVLQRTTETDLTRMLRTTHVRTVDRALQPTAPVSPRLATNVAGGVGAGLALGIGLALLLSRLDRRIKSVRDAEELGVTILGVLPDIPEAELAVAIAAANGNGNGARKRRKRPTKDAITGSPRDVIAHTQPMSSTAESCRTLRTNLMFMSGDEPLRTLAVTSAGPREGKTTVASNLAISIAQSGKRVLVIDTDMRRPRMHHAFGVRNGIGLTSVLVGEASLAQATLESGIPNVWVMTCGPIPPNPAELLHRERFQTLIDEAEKAYDFVIFDSPPLGAVTDAAVLGPQVDGVMVVLRANATTRDALGSVLRQVNDVGANLIGAVLNGVDPNMRRYEGGAGTYYYYRSEGYYTSAETAAGDDDPDDDEPAPSPPASRVN